jgi:hypothetical protein
MAALPLTFYSDTNHFASVKGVIFTKIHELQEVNKQLRSVQEMPDLERKSWLSENDLFLEKLLDSLTSSARMEMEDFTRDPAMLQLLIEYTASLREATAVIQTFLAQTKGVQSSKIMIKAK